MTALAIDVRGLTKSFGPTRAVSDVAIAMPKGQVWGFLGPNGSGKTTTLRMLCGLLKPDAGEGTCLGYDILADSARIKREVGYMTQKFSFWEDLSIRENLEFVARAYSLGRMNQRVDEAIERLGLGHRQRQLAGALSGGWKQRLALAACILHEPKLLLLDEPTAGVDPQARRDFWDQIHHLSAEGLTVLVSTHYMDEAERCDRIVYIAYGNVVARGTVQEVITSSGLETWIVEGEGVRQLLTELSGKPGIDHVAYFGAVLHVSGRDAAALERAIATFRALPGFTWTKTRPSLEDVFIDLMQRQGADKR
ncbi:MAG: ABC transporter ATP-binding protein [Alphaproteobacteria bacterium]|nr:ABC transporter ATP-binding protein [Alphaproteobacteria bacterium]